MVTYKTSFLMTVIVTLLTMTASAQTVPPTTAASKQPAIVDTGVLSVLNDGTVLIAWGPLDDNGRIPTDYQPDQTAAVLSEGGQLVYTGELWTILPADAEEPEPHDVRAVIPFTDASSPEGCPRYAVLEAAGFVMLTSVQADCSCVLEVVSFEGSLVFRADVVELRDCRPASPSPTNSCTAECPRGNCSVEDCDGVAWCFCGLFGEPHCLCIHRIFAFSHSPQSKMTTDVPDMFEATTP